MASRESAVGGGQPAFDIRTVRDHFNQRPVDIALALNCAPLAAMLDPALPLNLATAGHGCQVHIPTPSPSPFAGYFTRWDEDANQIEMNFCGQFLIQSLLKNGQKIT